MFNAVTKNNKIRRITMKKLLAILLAVAMLAGILTACSSDSATVKQGVKNWVTYLTLANEMETFNILYSQNNKELQVLTNCFDGLLSQDSRGNLIPACAEEWGTEDGGKTWTFKLRKGIQWVDMNGNAMQEVKAEDWLVGLEWVLNFHKNAATNTSMPIARIEGAGDYYTYTAG